MYSTFEMKAKFLEKQSKVQINFGSNDDPNKLLVVGKVYDLLYTEQHKWHTKIILKDFPNKKFNSVTFEVY